MDDKAVTNGEVFEPTPIPDKLFFKIGEVSQLVGVEAYVLRYWESEFRGLSPKKSSSGQRMFKRKDVELLLQIKHLLYDKKYTIEGARKALADKPREAPKPAKKVKQASLFADASDPIPEIRREIASILKMMA